MDFFRQLLMSGDFQPHGFCYRWNSGLVWLNVLSDALIALAYFTIPFTLLWFIRKRRDLPFSWMFGLFGVFIIACGTTHVMEVWNLWHAQYWMAGIIKAITAVASIPTAILLVQLVPKALALPSPDELKAVNQHLVDRTEELGRANAELASANKALQQFHEQQRLLFDRVPYPVWVYELNTLAITEVNESAIRSYGYTREEFLSLTIKDLRPAEDIPRLLENVKKTPEGAETAQSWRHRKKNGDLIDVEITSGAVVFEGRDARLVVATDITERKKAEQARQESEEKFRSLAETANDAILSADNHGNIVYFNPAAERLFHYSSSEAIGRSLTFLMPGRYREAHTKGFDRFLSTGEARVIGRTVEMDGVKKDGTEFPIEISLSSWRTREGVFFTGILSDITERKRAEAEILRGNAELKAVNQELEAFSYSVSHDLRAPLRSIDGFSLALLEDYEEKLDAGGKDSLHRVRAATQRMGVLIDDLLNLARITRTEMKLQSVDLSAMARSIAGELAKSQPERKSELRIREGLEAFADSHLVRIALENLLGNAWKFTSKRESASIEFGKTRCNGSLAYFVRDNGAGFDPAHAGRLFGAFQRLHDTNEFPGTGVGLATVQRIIHRHGGRIWAESAVEGGATFYFTLLEARQEGA